jgi:Immunity protein 26
MGKRRQSWKVGDVFLIRLKDESFVVGQIVGQEKDALNSVSCTFFDLRVTSEREVDGVSDLPLDKLVSVLFVTRDLLDSHAWRVVGNRGVNLPRRLLPFEGLRKQGWVGASVTGSGIVEKFLNAYYGLAPWDAWYDPHYLDELLISPDKKPATLLYKSAGPVL